VVQSGRSDDFDEVLQWQSRIDELAAGHDQGIIYEVLRAFGCAFCLAKKWNSAGMMWVRCAEACGAMKRFSMQVDFLATAGDSFKSGGDWKSAALWYESARDVSAEHGFISMESKSCTKLGTAFEQTGRGGEGVEQHRRAWAVAQSVGENDASHDRASLERVALRRLVKALCGMGGHLEEAEALFTHLREGGSNNADCRLWNHFLRGLFQMFDDNFEDASLSFEAAVDVASKHPEVLEDGEAASALKNARSDLQICGVGAGGAPPLTAVVVMVSAARASRDWPGVLRWESRLEGMLLTVDEVTHPGLISPFAEANFSLFHFAKAASLFQRRVQVLGKLERFSDQGADMYHVGECFLHLYDAKQAETWFQKARKLGEKHGCYVVECSACLGLGRVELYMRGRLQEAEELFRHALSVLNFVEGNDEFLERQSKVELAKVLLQTDRYEEAGPLIQRIREFAERASAGPFQRAEALLFAVRFQALRGDSAQALAEMQVQPSDPISHPPPERFSESGSCLSLPPNAPTRSGRHNPSGVHLLRYDPRRPVQGYLAHKKQHPPTTQQ
jgi:tetratricopeptide (TPR) repeat protein